VELPGDSDDDLEVEDREEDRLLGLGPEFLFEYLALGPVTVSAGVVGLAGEAAARAHLEMAPEPGTATGDDVADSPSLWPSELPSVRVITQDVGDFGAFGDAGLYDRTRQGLLAGGVLPLDSVEGALGVVDVGPGDVGVDLGPS
jgi:hypothetical protein